MGKTKSERFKYHALKYLSDGEQHNKQDIEKYAWNMMGEKVSQGVTSSVLEKIVMSPQNDIVRFKRGVYQEVDGNFNITGEMERRLKKLEKDFEDKLDKYVKGSEIGEIDVGELEKGQWVLKELKVLVKNYESY